MAGERRVVCVNREGFAESGSKITEYGVLNADRSVETIPHDFMMLRMRRGEEFYVEGDGRRASLEITAGSRGHDVIETVADGLPGDNLAALPTCGGDTQFIAPIDEGESEGDLSGEPGHPTSGPGDIDPPDTGDPTSHHDGGDGS
jgi:hypothetical protein